MSDEEFLEVFRAEADDLLEVLETSLLALEAAPDSAEHIAAAFRALHTLKGSGAMAGRMELADFAHHFEAVFDQLRSGGIPISTPLITISLAAKDHLRALVDEDGDRAQQESLLTALQEIVAATVATTADLPAAAAPSEDATPATRTRFNLDLTFASNVFHDGTNVLGMIDAVRALGDLVLTVDTSAVPDLDDLHPQKMYVRWHGTLDTSVTREEVLDEFMFLADDSKIRVEPVVDETGAEVGEVEAETPSNAANASPTAAGEAPTVQPAGGSSSRSAESVIKVQVDKLDRLVDLVGELVISKSRLLDIAAHVDHGDLTNVSEVLDRLIDELRDHSMGLRMLPIRTTFRRFERLVRDLSVELDKPLRLVTEGGDTELDKTVLDRLTDPLVHMIRNAADHAIEPAAVRQERGKPSTGTIRLCARQVESKIVIEVEDDGGGLNAEAIFDKAVGKRSDRCGRDAFGGRDLRSGPQAGLQHGVHAVQCLGARRGHGCRQPNHSGAQRRARHREPKRRGRQADRVVAGLPSDYGRPAGAGRWRSLRLSSVHGRGVCGAARVVRG